MGEWDRVVQRREQEQDVRERSVQRRERQVNEERGKADRREWAADERDTIADEREHEANQRERNADQRERNADQREQAAQREQAVDEHDLLPALDQDLQVRTGERGARSQAEIDREWARSLRDRLPGSAPRPRTGG